MTGGRRFSLSSPDWGQDHLSLDAIVAYVDDELAAGAHDRAEGHLACCPGCRAEVMSQRQARSLLRRACGPSLPSSLLNTLRSIPVEAELPPPPPGLGITADGQFVLLRDVPRADHGLDAEEAHRRPSRRARFGAVSGLALGALAVGVLAAPGPATPEPQGVLPGGAVPNVQARFSAAPDTPAVTPAVAAPAVANDPAAGDTTPQTGPEQGAVLDARVRDQLERRPVAFYYSTP